MVGKVFGSAGRWKEIESKNKEHNRQVESESLFSLKDYQNVFGKKSNILGSLVSQKRDDDSWKDYVVLDQ